MDQAIISKVCKKIYNQFPTFKGQDPKVSKQGDDRYLLVFSGSGSTPDGKTIQQRIRVVATNEGQIIKTSMSR